MMTTVLPHEGHVPTLPSSGLTRERHIYAIDYPPRAGSYRVFGIGNSARLDRPAKFFPFTSEGFAAAIRYRDEVLAGVVPRHVEKVKMTIEDRDALIAASSPDERKKIVSERIERDKRFRKHVLEYWGTACFRCGYNRTDDDGHPLVEAAHVVAVKDGGSDLPSNGRPFCATHHKEFDVGLWTLDECMEWPE